MTHTEVVAEDGLREWATAHKITAKTVDLLVKDGFSSMDVVELLDKEDLSQSKISRGQQKLLLKAPQPRQATKAEQTTEQTVKDTETTTAATDTCEDGAIGRVSLARENEAGGSWGQKVHILHVNVYRTSFCFWL